LSKNGEDVPDPHAVSVINQHLNDATGHHGRDVYLDDFECTGGDDVVTVSATTAG
jgi:hypothetical protein